MPEKHIEFLNGVWDDLKNEENNLKILNCLNSLDLVLYHYFYYSQNILKNTFYRISRWNGLRKPERWMEGVGTRLIKSMTFTINPNPTPDKPYINVFKYINPFNDMQNNNNMQNNNGSGGLNDNYSIKAYAYNSLKIESGSNACMMTPYGWMEGTMNDINLRVRRANQRVQNSRNKKQRAEEMREKLGDEVADAILGDYDAIPLVIPEDEVVNGYEISPRSGEHNFLMEEDYNLLVKIWLDMEKYPNFSDLNSFMETCDEGKHQFCSDWNKMDEFGECYGGYWKYPEGSIENEYAYQLSYRKNIFCLYSLPYPDWVLIKTVEWGCSSRQESVPFSNEICEWVRRKYNLLNPDGPELPIKTPVIPKDYKVNIYE